jgi:aldehyde:ferredoxin oxidoreductase
MLAQAKEAFRLGYNNFMSGYIGKSAKIDLGSGKIEIFETPADLRKDYLGGRGMGVALARDRSSEEYDSPSMPLIFATGPLVGTAAPTSGRMSVVSRSPLTGTIFDCSVGGRFGTELKKAGFDLLEIIGVSEKWITLDIHDGRIRLENAEQLYGMNISGLSDVISGKGSYAAIGRAGEKGVRFASIMIDGHYTAGRGGLGAVMGAKKLKLIRVSGSGPISVYDPSGLKAASEDIMRLLRASPAVFGELGLSEFGTPALVDLIHARRMEPTDNFRKTLFAESARYSGYAMKTGYHTKKTGCAGCPVLCKKKGAAGEIMPEYESVSHFGALNGCSDLGAIVEANTICNDYGIDTITAASTIACYSEISGATIGPAEMLKLLAAIGEKDGELGPALAEGSYRYALSQGRPELSMSVKKLELPAYDPRGAYGMALGYATSNRGGCHLRAYPVSHEILRKPVATDRFSFEGKARIIKIAEDLNAVVDSLTACKFVFFAAGLEEYSRALNAVTGGAYNIQALLRTGERIWNLEHAINVMNGFNEADDDLPPRFFNEEGSSGAVVKIIPIDRQEFLKARENYYRVRGYKV